MHITCAEKIGLPVTEETFFCSKCRPKQEAKSENNDEVSTNTKPSSDFNTSPYLEFIDKKYTKPIDELREIEVRIRRQRNNKECQNGRCYRITATLKGKICKARSSKTLIAICNSIINPNSLDHIPSIKYGPR